MSPTAGVYYYITIREVLYPVGVIHILAVTPTDCSLAPVFRAWSFVSLSIMFTCFLRTVYAVNVAICVCVILGEIAIAQEGVFVSWGVGAVETPHASLGHWHFLEGFSRVGVVVRDRRSWPNRWGWRQWHQ